MAATDLETPLPNPNSDPIAKAAEKRKHKPSKNSKRKAKRQKLLATAAAAAAATRKSKPSRREQSILDKRAKKYHSDSDDDADVEEREQADAEELTASSASESDDYDGEEEGVGRRLRGVERLSEGCRAFSVAFLKVMSMKLPNDPLGPVLAGHRKLVAAKLAEEVEERKTKGQARKEKLLAAEKGHVKPESYLDEKEKLLLSIAMKGVVRLFNKVSTAQSSRGLNPSRAKGAKDLARRRKQAFRSERGQTSSKPGDDDADKPGWAPLRDSYMLSSKLKDWDKMQNSTAAIDEAGYNMDKDDSSDGE